MTLSERLAGLYPCPENGFESYAGAAYILSLIILGSLYISRPINRRAIRRHVFGIKYKDEDEVARLIEERTPYKTTIIWGNIWMSFVRYAAAVVGFRTAAKPQTELFAGILCACSGISITAFTHMLYAHKGYKASKICEVFTVFFQTLTTQNSIIHWSRDHRCHHKFVDTEADPHDATRGFVFAHIGWACVERHPEVLRKGKQVDMSDLEKNPLLAFQRKYLHIITPLIYAFIWAIPPLLWGEGVWISFFRVLEYPWSIIFTASGFINSWSHSNGTRKYNSKITASDGTWVRELMSFGSGSHNFHHAFPRDVRGAERKNVGSIGAHVIYLLSLVGLAWDLHITPQPLIDRVKDRNNQKFKPYDMGY